MMPLGTERSLGYMTWGIARAITLLRARESEKSHLVLMLLLAAVEQYRLDGNWGAAWRLTHLGPPLRRLALERFCFGTTQDRPCAFEADTSHVGCGRDSPVEGRRSAYQAPSAGHGSRARRSSSSRQRPRPWHLGSSQRVKGQDFRAAPEPTSWHQMPLWLYRLLRASRANFSRFLRSSAKRGDLSALSSAELLPCPIPFPWEQPVDLRGSRRRIRRFHVRRALELVVNLEVCALNFCFLGMPTQCPPNGCREVPIEAQRLMIQSLRDRTCSISRRVDMSTGCGSKLIDVQHELASF